MQLITTFIMISGVGICALYKYVRDTGAHIESRTEWNSGYTQCDKRFKDSQTCMLIPGWCLGRMPSLDP